MTEEFQAIAELAKTAGKGIDAARELGGFLSKYIGGPLEQAIGIFEDKLKYLRWERQVRFIERSNELMLARGIAAPTKHIPLQLAIPLIQGASLEEDDLLQDRWVALLINAADANSMVEIRRAFISILEDLTSFDALLLEKIYSWPATSYGDEGLWTARLPELITDLKPDEASMEPAPDVSVSLGNLGRLGLIESVLMFSSSSNYKCAKRTPLGLQFFKAVSLQ